MAVDRTRDSRARACATALVVLLVACEQPSAVVKAAPFDGGSGGQVADAAAADAAAHDADVPDRAVMDARLLDLAEADRTAPDSGGRDLAPADRTAADTSARDQGSGTQDAGSGAALDWVRVQHGSFFMGSPASEVGHFEDETQHAVTLTRDFDMLKTEVTQRIYASFMGSNPSTASSCGPTCPVETVTWDQAAAFCNALSDHFGHARCYACTGSGAATACTLSAAYDKPYRCPGYRLPTEAEWEYAARATTTTATYGGNLDSAHLLCEQPNAALDGIAWFCGNSGGVLHTTASRSANAWDLQDMLGSVWEWCDDTWDREDYPVGVNTDPWGNVGGDIHVVRGGAYRYEAQYARAAFRGWGEHDAADATLGFRPVRTTP